MKAQPHALFHRDRFGTTLTIEVNSNRVRGASGERPLLECLSIRLGTNPFWSYQGGFEKSPIWNLPYTWTYATRQSDRPSYVHLLRCAVAYLTGNSGISSSGKPRLGFHSKYHCAKRAKQPRLNVHPLHSN